MTNAERTTLMYLLRHVEESIGHHESPAYCESESTIGELCDRFEQLLCTDEPEPLITFTIPGKPHAWQRPVKDPRTGRIFTPTPTTAAEKRIRCAALAAFSAQGVDHLPASPKGKWRERVVLRVSAVFVFPRPLYLALEDQGRHHYGGPADIDRCINTLLDGLQHERNKRKRITAQGVIDDDRQIREIGSVASFYASIDEDPHTTVKIWRLQ